MEFPLRVLGTFLLVNVRCRSLVLEETFDSVDLGLERSSHRGPGALGGSGDLAALLVADGRTLLPNFQKRKKGFDLIGPKIM